jgi:hypothetical protein
MHVGDYFRNYGQASDLEIFREEDLPDALPQRTGLYAWHARIPLTAAAKVDFATAQSLEHALSTELLERPRRQRYEVRLNASLEPCYEERVKHNPATVRLRQVADENTRASASVLFRFLAGAFSLLFSSPLYVGKAVQQTVAVRISQHLKRLHSHLAKVEKALERARRGLLEAERLEDPTHSL